MGGNWKTFKDYPHFEKKKASAPDNGTISTDWKVLSKCLKIKQAIFLFKSHLNDKAQVPLSPAPKIKLYPKIKT